LTELPPNATLIVIDVQKGFDDPRWGRRNNPQAETNIKRILESWRMTNRPVIHTQHCSTLSDSPLRPGVLGNEIKESASPLPSEPVLKKSVNSAFIGTDLESRLRQRQVRTVVMVGITTDHCVSTTARMAGNLGFDVYVVSDATATFDRTGPDGRKFTAEEIHAANLASLHREFATVIDSENLLKTLAGSSLNKHQLRPSS
jgi:nicotinamidase-related amidase